MFGLSRYKLLAMAVLFIILWLNIGVPEKEKAFMPDRRFFDWELRELIRGAVEDSSWMTSSSEEELRMNLGRHYHGPLLDQLVENAWDSIARPTDWYSRTSLQEMRMLHGGGKRALAEVLIGIEDVDTGHNGTGKGLFAMVKTSGGWRINYFYITWHDQY